MTTRSAPWAFSAGPCTPSRTLSTPTTVPNRPARPASTPASASSKTAQRPAGTSTAAAPARKVSGSGLPGSFRLLAIVPSILASKSPPILAAWSTWTVLALEETTAVRSPAARTAWTKRTEPGKTWTPSRAINSSSRAFLRAPSPRTVSASGGSSALPSGREMPREARNVRIPSSRFLPSTYRR